MAYLDHNHSHKRLAGVTGVALVHIVLAIGLTAGLAINYVEEEQLPPFRGPQIPLDPPTPTDTPTPTDDTVIIDRTTPPKPPIPMPNPSPTPVPTSPADPPTGDTGPTGGQGTGGTSPLPQPDPPVPTYAPRPPVPANGPAGWVTNDDYPRIAIAREYEGTVAYQVDVSAEGRVQACRVTSSSGHEVLDQASCVRIQRRARFRPATDRSGAEVAGSYRGSVSWQIPD